MRKELRALAVYADDAALADVVGMARADALEDRDIADLARVLAASGACLERDPQAADLASTGGPSSLSTLICPLHLHARGLSVRKLGVPGRPAGGIDVLETVPGFHSRLDSGATERALEQSSYVHLLADEHWAPLDARLFAYRQDAGAQNVPALVIASILAKKVAVGTVGAGLEIRVAPHGNFGVDIQRARRNAHRYNAIAELLDLRPVCILTDASHPYQPYIGRGEALAALAAVLDGKPGDWLTDHQSLCSQMGDVVADALGVDTSEPVKPAAIRQAHERMLLAHGASPKAFWERAAEVQASERTTISADKPGRISYDLRLLRDLLVDRQRREGNLLSDPAGVILQVMPGSTVNYGQPLLSIRSQHEDQNLIRQLASCAQIVDEHRDEAVASSFLEIVCWGKNDDAETAE